MHEEVEVICHPSLPLLSVCRSAERRVVMCCVVLCCVVLCCTPDPRLCEGSVCVHVAVGPERVIRWTDRRGRSDTYLRNEIGCSKCQSTGFTLVANSNVTCLTVSNVSSSSDVSDLEFGEEEKRLWSSSPRFEWVLSCCRSSSSFTFPPAVCFVYSVCCQLAADTVYLNLGGFNIFK